MYLRGRHTRILCFLRLKNVRHGQKGVYAVYVELTQFWCSDKTPITKFKYDNISEGKRRVFVLKNLNLKKLKII